MLLRTGFSGHVNGDETGVDCGGSCNVDCDFTDYCTQSSYDDPESRKKTTTVTCKFPNSDQGAATIPVSHWIARASDRFALDVLAIWRWRSHASEVLA